MLLNSYRLRKACAANANTTGFTAKAACRTTPPSGNLIFPVLTGGLPNGLMPARIRLFPYGLGTADNVFSLRIWGWTRLSTNGSDLWLPAILGEFSCTLGTFAGVAGAAVLDTELFCDTITVVSAVGEPTITADVTRLGTAVVYSPANNTPAYVELAIRGSEVLEFDFDQTTGTPTMNSLVQFIEGIG